jgi:OMF family outer membrane factor
MIRCKLFLIIIIIPILVPKWVVAAPVLLAGQQTDGDLADDRPSDAFTVPNEVEQLEIQERLRLSLEDVLGLARERNPEIQVARDKIAIARAQLRQARAALYPTLAAEVQTTRSVEAEDILQQRIEDELGIPTSPLQTRLDAPETTLTGSVSLTIDVFKGGERSAKIRAAQAQVALAQAQLVSKILEIETEAANAYFDLQDAAENVRIAQLTLANTEQTLTNTNVLLTVGNATRADQLRAEVSLANAQQKLVTAAGKQQIAESQLLERLNIPPGATVTVRDPVQPLESWNLSLEESILLAFEQRPELQEQKFRYDIAIEDRKAALAAVRPQFQIRGLLSTENILEAGAGSFAREADIGFGTGWSITGSLSWKLFDGFAASSQAQEADLKASVAEQNFAATRAQIQQQVTEAFANMQTNQTDPAVFSALHGFLKQLVEVTLIEFGKAVLYRG